MSTSLKANNTLEPRQVQSRTNRLLLVVMAIAGRIREARLSQSELNLPNQGLFSLTITTYVNQAQRLAISKTYKQPWLNLGQHKFYVLQLHCLHHVD
jgi:hypothetical protein